MKRPNGSAKAAEQGYMPRPNIILDYAILMAKVSPKIRVLQSHGSVWRRIRIIPKLSINLDIVLQMVKVLIKIGTKRPNG